MAWGLEARVPFLDKAFLEAAMNVDAKEKMFTKGKDQGIDADGKPKMEKVNICQTIDQVGLLTTVHTCSTSSEKHLTALLGAR